MSEYFNKLSPTELELLAHMAEESSEVVYAAMKIIRHGLYSDNNGQLPLTNREQLAKELGQTLAAIELLKDIGMVSDSELEAAKNEKLRNVWVYLHHHKPRAR